MLMYGFSFFIEVFVLGLGALNKAEFINHGGQDILGSFTPKKTGKTPMQIEGRGEARALSPPFKRISRYAEAR